MKPHRPCVLLLATVSGILQPEVKIYAGPHIHKFPPPTKQLDKPEPILADIKPAPLDLSVPAASTNAQPESAPEPPTTQPVLLNDLFAAKNQKPKRQVELEGGLIRTPDPEIEKRKPSWDGASLSINIKQ